MPRMLVTVALAVVCAGALAEVPAARRGELANLIRHECGSCHGLTLRGGLGPALTPDALRGRSPADVRRVIRDGLPGTAMPPWRELLSEDELEWIAGELLAGTVADGS